MKNKLDILSLDFDSLASELENLGCPSYRAAQVFGWLHDKRTASFEEMSNLPKALREYLSERFEIEGIALADEARSRDGTIKYLFEFPDGARVETVAMSYRHGLSVCLSSQVGCRMGCVFCATGRSGF
ncbi:MAG: 23S rRNA (adenine(2503)-C(2))-methyltransferase RlmN, partial [Oscillospiraceae bacterium]|nr:23S rRNA (adenine(2503)-C(2))-methyltransferase RlmN [Oscillospiraceae bacterium]